MNIKEKISEIAQYAHAECCENENSVDYDLDNFDPDCVKVETLIKKFIKNPEYDDKVCRETAYRILWSFTESCPWPYSDTTATFKSWTAFNKYIDTCSESEDWEEDNILWMKTSTKEVFNLLKNAWDENALSSEASKKTMKSKKAPVRTRLVNKAKSAGKKMLIRKVSRKIVTNVHSTIIKQLAANEQTAMIVAFLDTPIGKGIVSALLAVGMETLPLPENIAGVFEAVKDDLVDELAVQAFDQATVPVENAMAFLLPAIKDAMVPLLTSKDVLQLTEGNG